MRPAVVVVGASGILRPLVGELATGGSTVVAVARDPSGAVDTGGGSGLVVPCAADGRTAVGADAVVAAACAAHASAAVVYSPAAGPDLLRGLAGVVDRLVLVLPSAAAAPKDEAEEADWTLDDLPSPPHGAVPLVLGWRAERDRARWHTPDEVSAAALDVLSSGRPALLGRVRPWSDHP